MFQLTGNTLIQFISLVAYAVLLCLTTIYGQARLKKLFLSLLLASAAWTATSLLSNLSSSYGLVEIWKEAALLFFSASVAAYALFAAAFTQRGVRLIVRLTCLWLALVAVCLSLGYFSLRLSFIGYEFAYAFNGLLNNAVIAGNSVFLGIISVTLLASFTAANKPQERNRVAYLLAGLGLIAISIAAWGFAPLKGPAFYHLGHTTNAALMTYVLLKYRLVDIQLVMKKWLVYTCLMMCVTLAYLVLLLALSNPLQVLPPRIGVPVTVALVILFAASFNKVKSAIDKAVDKLFYGNRYVYRQILLDFASKMGQFIEMKEIAEAMLPPLTKALHARQAGLLLPGKDGYVARFVAKLDETAAALPVRIQTGSLLAQRLEQAGEPLIWPEIAIDPGLSAMLQGDRQSLDSAAIEILCPIASKGKLIGVLALSRKEPAGHYSCDDLELAMTLAKEAAVPLDNAQMYAAAKEKAHTDELTGLYNHRYFQDRLGREVERCSHQGSFALLFIDLDSFKTYNDVYGHVLGDEILRETGQIIRDSIRASDIGARYGGDEFAVILLEISLADARKVAERIRQGMETRMQRKSIALTASIGLACWREDGLARTEIIQAADSAVYRAKREGGNRVCLANGLREKELKRTETALGIESNVAIESIVYALAATVDARDHYTYGHSMRVCKYATAIAQAMGYSKKGIERLRAAALLHDIGKLHLPDKLLTKNEKLNEDDWKLIRNHPALGAGILKHIVGLLGCVDAVLFHHERYDGKGYPRGLAGKDIPLDARIMAVADAYEAMTSRRHYRERDLTREEAVKELERCAGTQFDPDIAKVFIGILMQPDGLAVEKEEAGSLAHHAG